MKRNSSKQERKEKEIERRKLRQNARGKQWQN